MHVQTHREYWNRHAKNYDRSMSLFGRPYRPMLELTAEAVRGASRVLEVAAGTGLVTQVLAREAQHVIATDYAPEMVAALKARAATLGASNVTCEQADLYALRYDPSSFDVVVAANVLHLVPDLPGAVTALARVLQPGGTLVVPTFCHAQTALSSVVSRLLALTRFPAARRFTFRSLEASIEALGLTIRRSRLLAGVIPIGYVEATFNVVPGRDQRPH